MVKILLLVILVTMLLVTGCVQPAAEVEDLDKLRSQLADSQAELAEKSKRIEAIEAKIAELEANVSQLVGPQAELAEKSERIEELETKLAGLEATITGSAPIHNGLFYDLHHVNMVKRNLDVEPWASAYKDLESRAEKGMGVEPEPIFGYWHVPWRDEDRPGWEAAVKPLVDSAEAMLACAQLYFFTGEEKFAEKAVEIANAWTGSLMDIKESDEWHPEGEAKTIATLEFRVMAIAFDMLRDYGGWSSDQKTAFSCWLNERTSYLIMRFVWAHDWAEEYQLAALAAAVGVCTEDREMFDYAVGVYKTAIAYDIAPDGHMPRLAGHGPEDLHKHTWAIKPLVFIAEIAWKQGLDLWGYTFKGKNLKLAIEYLLYFTDNPAEWPWSQEPQDLSFAKESWGWRKAWLDMAYYHYRDNKLAKYFQDKRPIFERWCGGMTTLTHGLPIE